MFTFSYKMCLLIPLQTSEIVTGLFVSFSQTIHGKETNTQHGVSSLMEDFQCSLQLHTDLS